jgi:hypothetical protein
LGFYTFHPIAFRALALQASKLLFIFLSWTSRSMLACAHDPFYPRHVLLFLMDTWITLLACPTILASAFFKKWILGPVFATNQLRALFKQ